ncbi:MAG: AMP-binding protein [Ruminiclostridium sp.]
MNYFYKLDHPKDNIAIITPRDGSITYGKLTTLCDSFSNKIISNRRNLVVILCKNTYEALCGYLGCLRSGNVPLMLDSKIQAEQLAILLELYPPDYIWKPRNTAGEGLGEEIFSMGDYCLSKISHIKNKVPLNSELALLLSTSGSTGSPKLVRLSKQNIQSNADAICDYLDITCDERPVTVLPMQYTYGLSILNSHLNKGAAILMTNASVMQNEFWEFAKNNGVTSLCGVPYTYQMYKRLKLFNMDIPTLKTMTQAGGKLSAELAKEFSERCAEKNINFFIMYGATEATARMSYLPPDKVMDKYTSIGIPIPGGIFRITDDNGQYITVPEIEGELVYTGANVMLGYAESDIDLVMGDEMEHELHTGDIAKFDSDGFFYIMGRKKRFIKLYGNRINLDEVEKILLNKGYESVCTGFDDKLLVFTTQKNEIKDIANTLCQTLHMNSVAFKIEYINEIPRSEAGKPLYSKLLEVIKNV